MSIEHVPYQEMRCWFLECGYTLYRTHGAETEAFGRKGIRSDFAFAYEQFGGDCFDTPFQNAMLEVIALVLEAGRNSMPWFSHCREKIRERLDLDALPDILKTLPVEEAEECVYDLKLLQIIPASPAELVYLLPKPQLIITEARATYEEIRNRFLQCYYDYDRAKLAYKGVWQEDEHEAYYAYQVYRNIYRRPVEILMLEILALILETNCRQEPITAYHRSVIFELLKNNDLPELLQQLPEEEARKLEYDFKNLSYVLYP